KSGARTSCHASSSSEETRRVGAQPAATTHTRATAARPIISVAPAPGFAREIRPECQLDSLAQNRPVRQQVGSDLHVELHPPGPRLLEPLETAVTLEALGAIACENPHAQRYSGLPPGHREEAVGYSLPANHASRPLDSVPRCVTALLHQDGMDDQL